MDGIENQQSHQVMSKKLICDTNRNDTVTIMLKILTYLGFRYTMSITQVRLVEYLIDQFPMAPRWIRIP